MNKKRKYKKRPYYGKKGGAAVYKHPVEFNIFSTLLALREYNDEKIKAEQN